jgi:hypothetical protein
LIFFMPCINAFCRAAYLLACSDWIAAQLILFALSWAP